MTGKLYAVGVGPGDPDLMTLKALKTIKNADCIACPESHGDPGIYSTFFHISDMIKEKEKAYGKADKYTTYVTDWGEAV